MNKEENAQNQSQNGSQIHTHEIKRNDQDEERQGCRDDGVTELEIKREFGVQKLTEITNSIYDTGEITGQMFKSILIAMPR